MNPTKVSRGSSFKGAASYLLAGHIGEENPDRVAWSATQNVGTEDIRIAAKIMAATWYDADEVKRANGWDGRGRGTTKKPVLHLVMSWDEGQRPDAPHMEQAARDMLKHMGLETAQAAMVGHNDSDHAHVHIIVNMIDPDTGTNIDLGNDKRKMQSFALDYSKAHGIESSPNRARNRELRDEAARTGDTSKLDQMQGRKRLSRDEWLQMKAELLDRQAAERGALKAQQGAEWAKVKSDMAARQAIERAAWRAEHQNQRARAKDENRAFWRDTFKRQKMEEVQSWKVVDAALRSELRARSFVGRAASFLGLGPSIAEAENRVAIAKMQHATLADHHAQQRAASAAAQGRTVYERTKAALAGSEAREIERRQNIADMKAAQDREWQALRERQQAEREQAGIKALPPKVRDQDNRPGVSAQEELRRESETARDRLRKADADRREDRSRSMRQSLRGPRDKDGRGRDR